ncbi:hypothetical protein V2J09_010583 [Rumex salicifolius]
MDNSCKIGLVFHSLLCHELERTCEDLDKIIRNFIWGNYGGARRPHLVDWKTVCLPKSADGIGVRSTREVNTTIVGKLGWSIINELASIWGHPMVAK